MKITFYISLLLALMSCTEDKPLEFSMHADELKTFVLNEQFESFYATKDSSCIEVITHEQLKAQEEITIHLGNHCDSVDIAIPAGGTITGASLYRDSTQKEADMIARAPAFSMLDFKNRFTVSSKLRGRYYLFYGSCHWSSRMWINFE